MSPEEMFMISTFWRQAKNGRNKTWVRTSALISINYTILYMGRYVLMGVKSGNGIHGLSHFHRKKTTLEKFLSFDS